MTAKHRQPPNGGEHWAIGLDGRVHLTAANAQTACGAESERAIHYRQVDSESVTFCDDCVPEGDG